MTENHGAHGDAGATDNEDLNAQETAATNESAAASMDARWTAIFRALMHA